MKQVYRFLFLISFLMLFISCYPGYWPQGTGDLPAAENCDCHTCYFTVKPPPLPNIFDEVLIELTMDNGEVVKFQSSDVSSTHKIEIPCCNSFFLKIFYARSIECSPWVGIEFWGIGDIIICPNVCDFTFYPKPFFMFSDC